MTISFHKDAAFIQTIDLASEKTMAELAASEAFNLTDEYYAKVEQGYKNDRVLYYQETIPFAEIAKSINKLRTVLLTKISK